MDTMFEIIIELIDHIREIGYVKFCHDCDQQKTKCGGHHELVHVISLAVKLYEKSNTRGCIISEKHRQLVSDWFHLKIKSLNMLNCCSVKQKEKAVTEFKNLHDATSAFQHLKNSSIVPTSFVEISIFMAKYECVVQRISVQSPNGSWEQLLARPFYDFDNCFANLHVISNILPATENCLCAVNHSRATQTLLRVAVDIFCISRFLQNNLDGRPHAGNIQRLLDEDKAVRTLLNAAQAINEVLHAYADDEILLSSIQLDFSLRSIHFIKNHLLLFDHHSAFIFTSLPELTKKEMDNEMELKLVALIAEYNHEYKDDISKMDALFQKCENLIEPPRLTSAMSDCTAFMGLMFKRLVDNERGNMHLQRIRQDDVYKVVHLKYLATKTRKISGNDLVYSNDESNIPQSYIRSMQVTEAFYRVGQGTKILSAALQAIFEANRYKMGQRALEAFTTDVLHICQRLGLQKQTVNLLLILGSLQMNEPDHFLVISNRSINLIQLASSITQHSTITLLGNCEFRQT